MLFVPIGFIGKFIISLLSGCFPASIYHRGHRQSRVRAAVCLGERRTRHDSDVSSIFLLVGLQRVSFRLFLGSLRKPLRDARILAAAEMLPTPVNAARETNGTHLMEELPVYSILLLGIRRRKPLSGERTKENELSESFFPLGTKYVRT